MTTKTKTVLNIGDASIEVELFAARQKLAIECLRDEDKLKEDAKEFALDFKEHVEAVHLNTKLPKKDIAAFWKARYEESKPKDDEKVVGTKAVIDRGELYSVLNDALDTPKAN